MIAREGIENRQIELCESCYKEEQESRKLSSSCIDFVVNKLGTHGYPTR